MSSTVDEVVPLRGGRITSGVVRTGDTVRRPASASSPFVASLLDLLESRGFTGAPRYLGRDQEGRDTFSYVLPLNFKTAQVPALRSVTLVHDHGVEATVVTPRRKSPDEDAAVR